MNRNFAVILFVSLCCVILVVAVYIHWMDLPLQGQSPSVPQKTGLDTPVEDLRSPPSNSPTTSNSTALALRATSSLSSGWTMYQDKLYEYLIEYPASSSLLVSDGGMDEHNHLRLQSVRIKFTQSVDSSIGSFTDEFAFNVTVYNNPMALNSKQWALAQWDASVVRSEQNILVNDLTGYKLTIFAADQDTDYIYFAKGLKVYELSYWSPDTMYDFSAEVRNQYVITFDKIVASFTVQ